MPDNPRLRTAEVGKIHLDPGARVQPGNPVLTLVHRRREHMVRSPRAGRVVPLIGSGDEVKAGDPLYVLHIDEAALEEMNREERALVAVEKEKWTSGVLADAIEPLRRDRILNPDPGTPGFVERWGKPVLALALYVLACFALLPILSLFGKTASLPVLIAMVLGCIAFAALIYYLYAPDSGKWPRRVVSLVAASWIGVSSVALFYQPGSVPEAGAQFASEGIGDLFDWSEDPLAPAPEPAPEPVLAVAQAGVAVGSTEARATPDHTAPRTVLFQPAEGVTPHGVAVRSWARVNPDPASGAVLRFDPVDRTLAVVPPVAGVLADAAMADARPDGDIELPAGLADAPEPAARDAEIVMAAIPRLQDAEPARRQPATDVIRISAWSLASIEARADRGGAAAVSAEAETLVALAEAARDSARAETMAEDTLALVLGEPTPAIAPQAQAAAPRRARRTDPVSYFARVGQPYGALSPALNLHSVVRVADAAWAEDQVATLAGLPQQAQVQAAPVDAAMEQRTADAQPLVTTPGPPLGAEGARAPGSEGQIALAVATPVNAAVDSTGTADLVRSLDAATYLARVAQPSEARTPALNLQSAQQVARTDWVDTQVAALATPVAAPSPGAAQDARARIDRSDAALQSANPLEPSLRVEPAARIDPEARIAFAVSEPAASPVDLPVALATASSTAPSPTEPGRVQSSRSPDLLLVSALRAGEQNWMLDQSDLLAAQPATRTERLPSDGQGDAPVIVAALEGKQAPEEPQVGTLGTLIGQVKEIGRSVLPVVFGEPEPPATGQEEQPNVQVAAMVPGASATPPARVDTAAVPGAAPVKPVAQPEPDLAQRDLVYLYFDDPRLLSHPQIGDPWEGLVSPELAQAIQRTEVVAVHEMLQVQNWCGAANDPDGAKRAELGADYTTALLNDRIRLLRVRLSVEPQALDLLEREIPLFDGTPAGFFHNKAPMLAGQPEDALMERGRDHLRSLSTGLFDPNAPDAIGGGQYFDSAVALSVILRGAGCDRARLNDGAGPTNEIGRVLSERLSG